MVQLQAMGKLQRDVSLKNYSNFKIGGLTSYFFEVATPDELADGLAEWKSVSEFLPEEEKNIFVLGSGTNILFSDEGFHGLVIRNKIQGLERDGMRLSVGSGVLASDIIDYCLKNSLQGMEWAGGLPGTIGGAVRGNAGAFGGEIKDSVYQVESIDLETQELKTRSFSECRFGYRISVFKMEEGKDEIITKVVLQFQKGDKKSLEEVAQNNITYRNTRHPLEYSNIGSIFKNIPFESVPEKWKSEFAPLVKNDPFPVVPTAKILVRLDLKGKRIGDAQVSEKHPNFIINLGNATARDVKALIDVVKQTVLDNYGIQIEKEVMFVE